MSNENRKHRVQINRGIGSKHVHIAIVEDAGAILAVIVRALDTFLRALEVAGAGAVSTLALASDFRNALLLVVGRLVAAVAPLADEPLQIAVILILRLLLGTALDVCVPTVACVRERVSSCQRLGSKTMYNEAKRVVERNCSGRTCDAQNPSA